MTLKTGLKTKRTGGARLVTASVPRGPYTVSQPPLFVPFRLCPPWAGGGRVDRKQHGTTEDGTAVQRGKQSAQDTQQIAGLAGVAFLLHAHLS